MRLSIVAFALSLLLGAISAEKDDSYYIAGTGNPNTAQPMYWKDGENILQDLSEFSALYVVFHQCAWTWMQMEDDGNDVDENDYWYMGKIPPMGANVAFSLYGSLKGHSFTGCGKDTFISTFYTDQGFNVFVDAMYLAGVSAFSTPYSAGLTADCQGGYGVGCDYNSGFAVHTYSSSQCDPQNATGISDNLSSLNSAMSNYADCVKIYDSNKYSGYTDGTALALLEYSHSCFYQDMFSPDGECPDPYGKLAQYQSNFHAGITESRNSDPYHVYYYRKIYKRQIQQGKLLTHVGVGFLAAAAILFILNENIVERFKNQRAKRKAAKKLTDDDDHGTEAIDSRADIAIEMAEGGIDKSSSIAKTRRDKFLGKTIAVCGDLKQTGTMDPDYVDESAAFAQAEYTEASEAFDRMCTAGGDACVDAADGADHVVMGSRSFDCGNDLIEGSQSFEELQYNMPLFKATSTDWATEVELPRDDALLAAQLVESSVPATITIATEAPKDEVTKMEAAPEKSASSDSGVEMEGQKDESKTSDHSNSLIEAPEDDLKASKHLGVERSASMNDEVPQDAIAGNQTHAKPPEDELKASKQLDVERSASMNDEVPQDAIASNQAHAKPTEEEWKAALKQLGVERAASKEHEAVPQDVIASLHADAKSPEDIDGAPSIDDGRTKTDGIPKDGTGAPLPSIESSGPKLDTPDTNAVGTNSIASMAGPAVPSTTGIGCDLDAPEDEKEAVVTDDKAEMTKPEESAVVPPKSSRVEDGFALENEVSEEEGGVDEIGDVDETGLTFVQTVPISRSTDAATPVAPPAIQSTAAADESIPDDAKEATSSETPNVVEPKETTQVEAGEPKETIPEEAGEPKKTTTAEEDMILLLRASKSSSVEEFREEGEENGKDSS